MAFERDQFSLCFKEMALGTYNNRTRSKHNIRTVLGSPKVFSAARKEVEFSHPTARPTMALHVAK
jgi:uncharacterized Fe-S cluster protein YjdI